MGALGRRRISPAGSARWLVAGGCRRDRFDLGQLANGAIVFAWTVLKATPKVKISSTAHTIPNAASAGRERYKTPVRQESYRPAWVF
jgi:hypothetical protein